MSKIAEDYKQTEVGVIPRDWNAKPMDEVSILIASGKSKTKTKVGGAFPIYGSTGIIGFSSKHDYEGERILVARVGANAGTINYVDGKYCVSDNTLMIQLKMEFDFSFIFYFLKYSNLNKLIFGSGQPLITGTQLKYFSIPLPHTKAEQTAIATALNDADALITQLERLIAKKRNIKQGAMQELLRPKEGWEVKKLGDVFRFLNTANNARADLLESGEVEYIHYGDIHTRWNCFLDCSKNELPFIDKGKITGVPLLENGDLVIADASEDYEGLGACIEINNIGKRKIIAGLHTLLLRGNKNILADGFKGNLRNYKGVKDALIRVSTGVSVFGISKTNLKEIEISIPSTIEEQNRIAQILSNMDAEIEALEKKLEKYKMLKQGMMQNLLTGRVRLV